MWKDCLIMCDHINVCNYMCLHREALQRKCMVHEIFPHLFLGKMRGIYGNYGQGNTKVSENK